MYITVLKVCLGYCISVALYAENQSKFCYFQNLLYLNISFGFLKEQMVGHLNSLENNSVMNTEYMVLPENYLRFPCYWKKIQQLSCLWKLMHSEGDANRLQYDLKF